MDRCDSKNILKNNNLKITKPREMILNEIIRLETSFSALTLFEKFKEEIDLVTIYRILNIFKENKIIREIYINEDSKFYEISCIHHPVHPHFHCKHCNKIFCLTKIDDSIIKNINNAYKSYLIEDVAITLSGFCEDCNKIIKTT